MGFRRFLGSSLPVAYLSTQEYSTGANNQHNRATCRVAISAMCTQFWMLPTAIDPYASVEANLAPMQDCGALFETLRN